VIDSPDTAARKEHSPTSPAIARRWLFNLGYAILLIVLALVPSAALSTTLVIPDCFAHAVAYGVQAGLLFWALKPTLGRAKSLAMGGFGAILFGLCTECLQLLQPERTVELRDVVANTIGVIAAAGAIGVVDTRLSRGRA
jgi:VanZ family protein